MYGDAVAYVYVEGYRVSSSFVRDMWLALWGHLQRLGSTT